MAECHPVGFQWVMEAKRRGAKVIHVDPRFTRTSAVADVHVPLRAGTDIAFLGGIINYVISNDLYFRDYVVNYTNAGSIVDDEFRDTEDLDGLFSGWDAESGSYDATSWGFKGRDDTLKDERCVFRILERHFSRYTPEVVSKICGVDHNLFLEVAATLAKNSGRERTSAFCYAVGWTQHSVGVQYIRTAAILQLLLGNIGRPGGGILALRGHASIQGSTDVPTLYNLLPGYLPMPKSDADVTLRDYIERNQAPSGWWGEFPKYIVSLLKAYFGERATAENDYCFDYLPRLTGDHSHMSTVSEMADGQLKGYFVMGENPSVGSMNGALQRKGLRALEWMVVRDFHLIETAEFWRSAPEIESGEVRTEDIETEVFFFPAASHTEKDGTFTNTQRLLQWHHKAVDPTGDARSELHFMYHLGLRLKEMYKGSRKKRDRAIKHLTWDYPTEGAQDEPSAEAVLREVNGYRTDDGSPVSGFTELTDDGSTACGCWIYSGSFAEGVNQPARRKPGREQSWVAPEWGWAWPANRRLLYNRASADPEGEPWSERKRYVWWDGDEQRWAGEDVADFIVDRPPSYRPKKGARGVDTVAGDDPFIMLTDGKGSLFVPDGLQDGPLPAHYEPVESVVPNALYGQNCNPARMEFKRRDNRYHKPFDDERFPFVVTTYRLTEHHTAGGMSRWVGWLSELQPEMFCEVSSQLAKERNLVNGGWATITTARSQIEARVLVTDRIKPLRLGRREVHQIGLPYHWGSKGIVTGDATNELIGFVADPNVSIQESKALTADIAPGRRDRSAPPPDFDDEDSDERDLPHVRSKDYREKGPSAAEGREGRRT
ncbi:molybdopterin-dependent oxidoreductase [soil metagenome]